MKNHRTFCCTPLRGCNIFGFMRLQRLFRYIWFYIGNTFVAFCRNGRIGLFTFPFLSYFAKPIFTFYYFADLFVIESFEFVTHI